MFHFYSRVEDSELSMVWVLYSRITNQFTGAVKRQRKMLFCFLYRAGVRLTFLWTNHWGAACHRPSRAERCLLPHFWSAISFFAKSSKILSHTIVWWSHHQSHSKICLFSKFAPASPYLSDMKLTMRLKDPESSYLLRNIWNTYSIFLIATGWIPSSMTSWWSHRTVKESIY